MAFWACPRFDDRLRDHRARLVWTLLVFDVVTLTPAAIVSTPLSPRPLVAVTMFGSVLALQLVCLSLLSRRRLEAAASLLVGTLLVIFSVLVFFFGALHHPHVAGFMIVILLARVAIGARAATIVAALSGVACGTVAILEALQAMPPELVELRVVDDVLTVEIFIVFGLAFVHFSTRSLERAFEDERLAGDRQTQLAAQANTLAKLGQAATSATSAETFAETVVNATATTTGARTALVVELGGGRARVLAVSGLSRTGSFSSPETKAILERLAHSSGPSILAGEHIAGLPDNQVAAPIATTEGTLGVFLAAFDDRETAANASPFVETAASLLATTFERERQRDRSLQVQKLDVAGRLAASVGHEFNNLLAGILGDASTIGDETTGATKTLAAGIVAAAQRGAMLTRRLLTVAKKQVARAEPADVSEEVQRFHAAITRWIPPSIQTELVLADVPLNAQLDRSEYEQLLHALSSNAVHAMPNGGTLSLRTRREVDAQGNAWAVVEVADTGVGIGDGAKAHLFEPFFTTRSEGAGLGLFTVRTIVEKNGGQLRIDSAVNVGTTVRVLWPLGRTEPPTTAVERSNRRIAVTPEEKSPRRILVVDDEIFIRKSMVRILGRAGYEVLQADDGIAALEILEDGPQIALIVTDAVMPRLNGPELAARARDEYGVPSILVSGYTTGLIGRAADLPFLAKPFMPNELIAIVQQTLPPEANDHISSDLRPVEDERLTQAVLHGLLPVEAAATFAGIGPAASWVYDVRRDEVIGGAGFAELYGLAPTPEWRGKLADLEAHVVEIDRPALFRSRHHEGQSTDRVRVDRTDPYRVLEEAGRRPRWLSTVIVKARGWPRVFGWTFDCTAEMHEREIQRRAADALSRVDHAQLATTIAGQIAHDLNNYLTVVLSGATDLADRAELDQELSDELSDIIDAARRCVEMSRRLLRLSRTSIKHEPLAIHDISRDMERLLERLVRERGKLELAIEPDLPYVLGDRGAFERALANLVINARDALEDRGGKIVVSVEKDANGWVKVKVADDGIGMPADVRAHLFEPFFSTKRSAGNGLGLATVKATVDAMRGKVEVQSEPGRGTTFELSFPPTPIRPEPPTEPDAGRQSHDAHDVFAEKTVLVADGDDSVSAVITASLAPHHTHTLTEATELGARRAIERASTLDFVVLDTTLRDGSWPRVLASLRESRADIPVIVTTAGDPRAVAVEPSDRHTRILAKPYTLSELAAELERASTNV